RARDRMRAAAPTTIGARATTAPTPIAAVRDTSLNSSLPASRSAAPPSPNDSTPSRRTTGAAIASPEASPATTSRLAREPERPNTDRPIPPLLLHVGADLMHVHGVGEDLE